MKQYVTKLNITLLFYIILNQISNSVTLVSFNMHFTLTQSKHCHKVNTSPLSHSGHTVPGDYRGYNLPCFTLQSIFTAASLENITPCEKGNLNRNRMSTCFKDIRYLVTIHV